MSNYYNNQGIYGQNQGNNIYRPGPGQNIYQASNYAPPSNYGNNNYNQNIYSPGNYAPNQNQNQNINGPQPFIAGKIGRLEISSEDLETFSKSLKSAEWTTNKNYLQAKDLKVGMKLSLKGQLQSDVNIPRNRFNEYNINSNFNSEEFQNFLKNAQEENRRKKDEVEREKNEFLRVNFPNEKPDISDNDLYRKIGEKKKDVIEKDSNLYGKVGRLLPLLRGGQSSGIYAY